MDWDNIKKEYNDKLEFFKDPKFIFEEESHSYTFNGIKYDSVTTFLKRFKVPFEREYWIKRKSREMGIEPSVLESEWAQKANTATELGTRVHKWIEDFWTGLDPELPE
ncbi:MAG: hypothetical protein ACK55I_04645, partial [bacterium]